jgi:hypothetical protein
MVGTVERIATTFNGPEIAIAIPNKLFNFIDSFVNNIYNIYAF